MDKKELWDPLEFSPPDSSTSVPLDVARELGPVPKVSNRKTDLLSSGIIGSFADVPEDELCSYYEVLRDAGLKWIAVLSADRAEIIYYSEPTEAVLRGVGLRLRAVGVEPPPLSPDEYKELLTAYGATEEEAQGFRDHVLKLVARSTKEGPQGEKATVEKLVRFCALLEARVPRREYTALTDEQREMVLRHLGLADSIANRFFRSVPGAEEEDVFQQAYLALIRAVSSYDPGRGISFGTYAYRVIENELRDMLWRYSRFPRWLASVRDRFRAGGRGREEVEV